jgi:hypothetical protein
MDTADARMKPAEVAPDDLIEELLAAHADTLRLLEGGAGAGEVAGHAKYLACLIGFGGEVLRTMRCAR